MSNSADKPDEIGRATPSPEHNISLHGFPGLTPLYKPVDRAQISAPPHKYFGQVKTFDSRGQARSIGTGWLWSGGIVVTAAHILYGASTASCLLNNGFEARWETEADLHPEYLDSQGFERVGSPHDLAVMPLRTGSTTEGLDIQLYSSPTSAISIGYPGLDEPLVEHEGEVWQSGRYYGHAAHTTEGHSGSALVVDGCAVGLHVGVISLVRRWQQDQPIQEHDGANAAIIFRQDLLDFLQSRVRQI